MSERHPAQNGIRSAVDEVLQKKPFLFLLIGVLIFISGLSMLLLHKEISKIGAEEDIPIVSERFIPTGIIYNSIQYNKEEIMIPLKEDITDTGFTAGNLRLFFDNNDDSVVYLRLGQRLVVYTVSGNEQYSGKNTYVVEEDATQSLPEEAYTREFAIGLALSWIESKSRTYARDGKNLMLKSIEPIPRCDKCYRIEYWFESSLANGVPQNKADDPVTWHKIVVDVEKGEVTSAIIDDEWDDMG